MKCSKLLLLSISRRMAPTLNRQDIDAKSDPTEHFPCNCTEPGTYNRPLEGKPDTRRAHQHLRMTGLDSHCVLSKQDRITAGRCLPAITSQEHLAGALQKKAFPRNSGRGFRKPNSPKTPKRGLRRSTLGNPTTQRKKAQSV